MRAVTLLLLHLSLLIATASPAAAETITVARVEISDWRPVFGVVDSRDRAEARVRLAGTLTALSVTEGDTVTAGQVIARVEDEKIGLNIAALAARLRSLDAEAAQATLDLGRTEELRARGTVAEARLDEARTRLEVIRQTHAAIDAERAALNAKRAEGDVRAPEAGRVLSVPVVRGMPVQPGETVAVIAANDFILRTRLPERHARFLGVGESVRIAERGALSGAGTAREGEIVKVYPEIESGQVVVDVETRGLGDYFVGERIRLDVATGRRQAIVVPEAYLDRRYGVTFARLDGGAEIVVQPGLVTGRAVEILSGLRPGDRLISYGTD